MQYKEFYLTSQTDDALKTIKVIQSDTARSLKIKLLDLDISSIVSATIYILKPDKTSVYNNCTISDAAIIAPLSAQSLAVVGEAEAQLQLYDGSEYISSYSFVIEILPTLVDQNAVQSSNEFNAVSSLLYKAGTMTVDSMSEMTDTNKTYFLTTNQKIYYYDTTEQEWKQGSASMQSAAEEISTLSVSATTLPTGSSATATKTKSGDIYNINFGLPRGEKGENGSTGFSPSASVVKTGGTAVITITDATGTTTASVSDGQGLITDVQVDGTSIVSSGVANIDLSTRISPIENKIPSQASSSNQLADKAFVNSSIATATATFKGTYSTLAELQQQTADENDYGFVTSTDSAGNTVYNRYKYTNSTWTFEYALNNSSFTSAQWTAIQSGITSALVTQITTNQNNIANKLDSDDLIDIIYPVGSIITLATNTDPNTIYTGTTWTKIQDSFLLGQGTTYSTLGGTGGSADAILVSHSHTFTGSAVTSGGQSQSHSHTFTGSAVTSGGQSQSHSHTFTGSAVTSGTQSANHTHTVNGGSHSHKARYKLSGAAGSGLHAPDSSTTTYKDVGTWIAYDGGHTHTVGNNSANHTHSVTAAGTIGNASQGHTHSVTAAGTIGNASQDHTHSVTAAGTIDTQGSSATGANMPPYTIVAFWKRTA